ncbi:hypothetical protein B296_00019245 [Ensete ventricosum]|uniref:Uncharacterized protein n=1 Tax=Ensete ventricosum TaxID=4639 RepID=A0A427ADJ7_ENSVE|nr:hypothetical protein B296_00019245 [Ensete ventricosum]
MYKYNGFAYTRPPRLRLSLAAPETSPVLIALFEIGKFCSKKDTATSLFTLLVSNENNSSVSPPSSTSVT